MLYKLKISLKRIYPYLVVTVSMVVLLSMLALSGGAGLAAELVEGLQAQATPAAPRAVAPLTDVAPEPRAVDVRADEHPAQRLRALGLESAPPQAAREGRQPSDVMDLRNPPQWSAQQAGPAVPSAARAENRAVEGRIALMSSGTSVDAELPVPPDPFAEPPVRVNPERGKRTTDPGPPWMESAEEPVDLRPRKGR